MMDCGFLRAAANSRRLVRLAIALLVVCVAVPRLRAEPTGPVDPNEFLAHKRAAGRSLDRYGDVPLGAIIRTDERYYKMGIFEGPRGWPFWNLLANPKNFQNPNLWPDKRPTYFVGQLVLPAGSSVTIKGRFPFARYFKFTAYKFENNTFIVIPGTALPGYDIVPDPGSVNPYAVGADRLADNRNFTIHLRAENLPANNADRATNTAYVGADGVMIMATLRIYVSDEGYDAAGWGPGDTATASRSALHAKAPSPMAPVSRKNNSSGNLGVILSPRPPHSPMISGINSSLAHPRIRANHRKQPPRLRTPNSKSSTA